MKQIKLHEFKKMNFSLEGVLLIPAPYGINRIVMDIVFIAKFRNENLRLHCVYDHHLRCAALVQVDAPGYRVSDKYQYDLKLLGDSLSQDIGFQIGNIIEKRSAYERKSK